MALSFSEEGTQWHIHRWKNRPLELSPLGRCENLQTHPQILPTLPANVFKPGPNPVVPAHSASLSLFLQNSCPGSQFWCSNVWWWWPIPHALWLRIPLPENDCPPTESFCYCVGAKRLIKCEPHHWGKLAISTDVWSHCLRSKGCTAGSAAHEFPFWQATSTCSSISTSSKLHIYPDRRSDVHKNHHHQIKVEAVSNITHNNPALSDKIRISSVKEMAIQWSLSTTSQMDKNPRPQIPSCWIAGMRNELLTKSPDQPKGD